MKALVTFGLGKLTIGYAHRIYEGLQQYQWQVHEPLCHGRPVLPAPETPASDAICTDMTGYTGGVIALPKTAIAANIPSTGSKPTETSASNPTAPSSLPAKEERVDYLAGLVALELYVGDRYSFLPHLFTYSYQTWRLYPLGERNMGQEN